MGKGVASASLSLLGGKEANVDKGGRSLCTPADIVVRL